LRRDLADIPGVRISPAMRQGLTRNFGQPLQFVLQGRTTRSWPNGAIAC
jgi:hypothetical protein